MITETAKQLEENAQVVYEVGYLDALMRAATEARKRGDLDTAIAISSMGKSIPKMQE